MTTYSFFYWLPRILAGLCISFLAIFAFDVFIPGKPIKETLLGFLIHLVPSYFLFVALLIAWRKEELGGFLFILIGIFFTFFFKTYEFLSNFLLISLPVFFIGILFLFHDLFFPKKNHG